MGSLNTTAQWKCTWSTWSSSRSKAVRGYHIL